MSENDIRAQGRSAETLKDALRKLTPGQVKAIIAELGKGLRKGLGELS